MNTKHHPMGAVYEARIATLESEVERLRLICFDHELGFAAAKEEIDRLRELMRGWRGYGWKDDVYIDSLDEFFNPALDSESQPQPTPDS